MKIAVLGLEFPLGKKNIPDERLDKLNELLRPPKVTSIQIEFQDNSHLKDADGILCAEEAKQDLILTDLETLEQKIMQDSSDKELFLRVKAGLEKEALLSEIPINEEEKKLLAGFNLITLKPVTSINPSNMPPVPEIIKSVYINSGRISFFTANERELRAWSILKGASAYQVAGLIHSDIQKGFIKAEVISYQDLIESGGINQAKAKGVMKLEGKDYSVKDGDLIKFRFNK